MDVLELPRPVINFLRTMAKESCRYVLSWDIFGGTDTVTLTLTWKLNDNESQLSTLKVPQQPMCEDLYIHHNDSISSSHCSRRENNTSTSTRIIRSSRGKSLEGNNLTSTKLTPSHQKHVSSLERKSSISRQKIELEPIYTNLNNVKYSTSPSPYFRSNKNQPSSFTHTYHHRTKKQYESPIRRKFIPSTSTMSNTSPESRRTNHITIQTNDYDDDDNDVFDPWIKNFECSLEDNTNNIIENSENDINKIGSTSGKVKFKRKPDYF
ncbi:unnamed protein product [Rotaria sp. Silwood1]|nr:unnamed protein product [Rotaria sp. Silwood1]CAF3583027.1 unnamed protein product [Rotaria sp. Silwood1]CAF4698076.1 unnamed protein product [Rotaria sp. Silwood1]